MNTLLSSLCSHLHLKPEHTALLDERDTSDVWRQFAIWSLVGPDDGVIRFTKPDSLQYNAIVQVAQLYIEDCKDIDAWKAASAAASSASAAAAAAAASASAAWSAAWAAAWAAAWSANTSYYAADASAAASYAADAAGYAADDAAAADAHYERIADKLIELINAAPLITTNKQFQS